MSDEAPMPQSSYPPRTIFLIGKGSGVLLLLMLVVGIGGALILRVRHDAAITTNINNLRGLGLGVHNCNDAFQEVPLVSGYWKGTPLTNKTHRSIYFVLLPYTDKEFTYNSVQAVWTPPPGWPYSLAKFYINPADLTGDGSQGECSYAANWQVFQVQTGSVIAPDPVTGANPIYSSIPRSFPDGQENVVMFAEIYQKCNGIVRRWAQTGTATDYRLAAFNREATHPKTLNESLSLPQINPKTKDCSPSQTQTPHPRAMNVCLGDASARPITTQISLTTWRQLCAPADGQSLGSDW